MFRQVTGTTAGREHTTKTDNEQFFRKCKLSCCSFCTFCARAFPKERNKSQAGRVSLQKSQIKICVRCFMCHSIVLCQTCNKCQKCCPKPACRGQTANLLANLAGSECRSDESSSNPERGLCPPLSGPAKAHKVSRGHKLLCKSPQEQLPAGGIASAYSQKCCRTGKTSNISGVFQPTISSPKAQQVEAHTRSEQTESFPQDGEIQNGDTRNHQNIPPTRGVGHLNRLQGCLLPYTDTGTVQEISEISCRGSDIPIQSTALWSVHSTLGVNCSSKGGETDGHTQGYKNPPVPRRLVGESQILPGLSPAYSKSSENISKIGLLGECRQVGNGSKADL